MYGMVNKAIEEMVVHHHGPETWERIKKASGVGIDSFMSNDPYPDEVTYKLVGAASEVLGRDPKDVLRDFGQWWVLHTAVDGYGALMDAAGSNLPEFLANLNNLHTRVGMIFPKLTPPRFECGEVTDHSLLLHHYTERPGLGPMVVGLVEGLAKRFDTPVRIEHVQDRSAGADHDVFRVEWPPG